jgi:ribulose bisphosphate carboxylase small subunit
MQQHQLIEKPQIYDFSQHLIRSDPGLLDPFKINTFDIDGVIWLPEPYVGLRPELNDIIITGRSIEEEKETYEYLESRGIYNEIYFNPLPFDKKTRKTSGEHKATVLRALLQEGYKVGIHWEDDPVQAEIIRNLVQDVTVVEIRHNLVELENVHRYNSNKGDKFH